MVRGTQDKDSLSKIKAPYETQSALVELQSEVGNSRLGQIEGLVCKGCTLS